MRHGCQSVSIQVVRVGGLQSVGTPKNLHAFAVCLHN